MAKKVVGLSIKFKDKLLEEDCELILQHIKKLREVKSIDLNIISEREIRKEFLGLNIIEIDELIKQKQETLKHLVGNLYSSIILDEISELEKLKNKKLKDKKIKYDVISKQR